MTRLEWTLAALTFAILLVGAVNLGIHFDALLGVVRPIAKPVLLCLGGPTL